MAILAAMSITVQRSAVESTRRERTIVTIRKIDAALTSAYEKYQYRKPDVSFFINNIEETLVREMGDEFRALPEGKQRQMVYYYVLLQIVRTWFTDWLERSFSLDTTDEEDFSVDNQFAPYILRTLMLRELLLADFPDCLAEVNYNIRMGDSPVQRVYQDYRDRLESGLTSASGNTPSDDISADLLYLIIMNTSAETRGAFLDRETADTNNNGIPEFIDGWGNPIRLIRWAPALENSNRQPTFAQGRILAQYRQLKRKNDVGYTLDDSNSAFYDGNGIFYSEILGSYPASDYDFFTYFDDYYPGLLESSGDPFDPMESMNGWLLTPLIYSAGPDKSYGMTGMETYGWVPSPFGDAVGNLGLGDETGEADDNITNHNLE